MGEKSAWDAASQHPAYYPGLVLPFDIVSGITLSAMLSMGTLLEWRYLNKSSFFIFFRFSKSVACVRPFKTGQTKMLTLSV